MDPIKPDRLTTSGPRPMPWPAYFRLVALIAAVIAAIFICAHIYGRWS
jgi:hypothetical protein